MYVESRWLGKLYVAWHDEDSCAGMPSNRVSWLEHHNGEMLIKCSGLMLIYTSPCQCAGTAKWEEKGNCSRWERAIYFVVATLAALSIAPVCVAMSAMQYHQKLKLGVDHHDGAPKDGNSPEPQHEPPPTHTPERGSLALVARRVA